MIQYNLDLTITVTEEKRIHRDDLATAKFIWDAGLKVAAVKYLRNAANITIRTALKILQDY